jgi:hypothetical protein
MVPTGENRSVRSKCHVVSHRVQSMRYLLWAKWHWDRLFLRVLRFFLFTIIPLCLHIRVIDLPPMLYNLSSWKRRSMKQHLFLVSLMIIPYTNLLLDI